MIFILLYQIKQSKKNNTKEKAERECQIEVLEMASVKNHSADIDYLISSISEEDIKFKYNKKE